jgi:hypothetical protein
VATWALVLGAVVVAVTVFGVAFYATRGRDDPPWWL